MNAIKVIAPYKYLGMWVFDDPRVGLSAEPFVGGADSMIDRVVSDLPDPENGFIMVFSGETFPGSQFTLQWRRQDRSGNIYYSPELDQEGWLCPALFRYFVGLPMEIHVQIKAKPQS